MTILIIILLLAGSAAFLFFFGNIVRAFGLIVSAIIALVAAFAWFELLAAKFVSGGTFSSSAYSTAFLLIYLSTFFILALFNFIFVRPDAELNLIVERAGRIICGMILGFILSGAVLVGLVLAPLSNKSPYQRFNASNPNLEKPGKSLLLSDDFVTNLFNYLSSGSLGGKNTFSALHPNFLNQTFLNRINSDIPLATTSNAIEIPAKAAVWPAPENLKDSDGKKLPLENGSKPMIARIGIRKTAVSDAGAFSLSQVCIICADNSIKNKGEKINKYPIGYLTSPEKVKLSKFSEVIKLEPADFIAPIRWIDFIVNIPENATPVFAKFKQNNIAQLPLPVTSDQAPLSEPFLPQSKCATGSVKVQKAESAVYGVELQANDKFLDGFEFQVKDANHWQSMQSPESIKPAVFENNFLLASRAQLQMKEPNEFDLMTAKKMPVKKVKKQVKRFTPVMKRQTVAQPGSFSDMLKVNAGYKLLSLKCNNPDAGKIIKSEQLPILHDLSGLKHYPVGLIASTRINNQIIYEIDYCSIPADSENGCLVIGKNGNIEKAFPDEVWITEKTKETKEFYLIYTLKTGSSVITSIINPDGTESRFEKFEGFSIK